MEIRKRKGGVVYRDQYMSEGFAPVTVTLYPGDGDVIRVDELYPDGTPGNELNMFRPDEPAYAKVARYVTHTRGAKKATRKRAPKKKATRKRAAPTPKQAAKKRTLREQAACLRQCLRGCR